ncbi:MAG: tRNA (guanosine(37)-N1)-methyltransferase TrmD [Acidobacteriota bacterium]|nr:tRNA (guanosine(37)-N1)-methyltransferase TrmD [Acidobacteriota bacterium]MDQ5873578.1 tRNA (guanosine(37)-N1)-methyltransferase TrmD [Acidobacteriota bacterium]
MEIEILTLFPEYFRTPFGESLLGKAIGSGVIGMTVTDLRSFAEGRHRKADDEPYGGGAGMVMMAPVLAAAIEARREPEGQPRAWTVLLTPDGVPLAQRAVEGLAARDRILLVCGRYEGIDERARLLGLFDEEVSLGDFVLPGGEAAALAVTEAVSRLVPGVVGSPESLDEESFSRERLDYPHYTRPREFRGLAVPDALVSGDHARIRRWRRARALERTRERRPDLLGKRPEEPGEGQE